MPPLPQRVRYSRIRKLAVELLAKCAINAPPVDVFEIAQRCGATIQEEELGEDVSGILVRGSGNSPVIGVAKSQALPRRRFTIAHELGHLLLHEGRDLYVDRSFRVNYRSDRPADGVKIEETEANVFAAELLMPVQFLNDDGDFVFDAEGPQLGLLAAKYQVSPEAMSWRLFNLYRFRT